MTEIPVACTLNQDALVKRQGELNALPTGGTRNASNTRWIYIAV
jgi:hypothetical protein